jgi:hypothetical protein
MIVWGMVEVGAALIAANKYLLAIRVVDKLTEH